MALKYNKKYIYFITTILPYENSQCAVIIGSNSVLYCKCMFMEASSTLFKWNIKLKTSQVVMYEFIFSISHLIGIN